MEGLVYYVGCALVGIIIGVGGCLLDEWRARPPSDIETAKYIKKHGGGRMK